MEPCSKRSLKTIFGLVAFILTTTMQAQSLEQEDLLPEVGATWHMRALQVIPDLPPAERPIVWDFIELTGNDVFGAAFTMLPASAVPASAAYPGTDRVLRKIPDNGSGPVHTFLDVQTDKTIELALVAPLVSSIYDPGALMAGYPLMYNQELQGAHCFTAVSPGVLTPYCGSTEIRFLHTGLLRLNFGEFFNSRLVRTRRTTVSELDPADSTLSETLTWYAGGIPYPLLQFTTLYYANGTQARSGYILDETSVVGLAEGPTIQRLEAFPVPSSGAMRVMVPESGILNIVTADGKLVHTERLTASATPVPLHLEHLPDGAYRALLNGERTTRQASIMLLR